MKYIKFLLFLLIFTCFQAQASSCSDAMERLLGTAFERSFFDESVYTCGYCHRNIYRLLKKIESNSFIHLDELNVLFIVSDQSSEIIPPSSISYVLYTEHRRDLSRLGTFNQWLYHVVLEHQGKIYDFDYSSNAKVSSVLEFFEDFIGSKVNVFKIPADAYVSSIYRNIVNREFSKIGSSQYLLTYQQFIEQL